MKFLLATFLLASVCTNKGTDAAIPKMLAEPAWPGKQLGPASVERSLSSNSTTYVGDCDPGRPFAFALYGPSGVGAIGVTEEATRTGPGITVEVPGAEVHLGNAEQRFFGFGDDDEQAAASATEENYQGYPLEYIMHPSYPFMDGISAVVQHA